MDNLFRHRYCQGLFVCASYWVAYLAREYQRDSRNHSVELCWGRRVLPKAGIACGTSAVWGVALGPPLWMSICELAGCDSGRDSAGRWRISGLLGLVLIPAGPRIVVWTLLHLPPCRPRLLGNRTRHHLARLPLLCRLRRKGWGQLIYLACDTSPMCL
jgi:MFS family permease